MTFRPDLEPPVGEDPGIVGDSPLFTEVQSLVQRTLEGLTRQGSMFLGQPLSAQLEKKRTIRTFYSGATWVGAGAAYKEADPPPTYTKMVLHRPFGNSLARENATSRMISAWVADPRTDWAPHFTVTESGGYLQHVDLANVAYHTGDHALDATSLGLAIPGRIGDLVDEPVLLGLARLVAHLGARYGLDVQGHFLDLVVPHSSVAADRADPGVELDFVRLSRLVGATPVQDNVNALFVEYETLGEDQVVTQTNDLVQKVEGEGVRVLVEEFTDEVLSWVGAQRETDENELKIMDLVASRTQDMAGKLKTRGSLLRYVLSEAEDAEEDLMEVTHLPEDVFGG